MKNEEQELSLEQAVALLERLDKGVDYRVDSVIASYNGRDFFILIEEHVGGRAEIISEEEVDAYIDKFKQERAVRRGEANLEVKMQSEAKPTGSLLIRKNDEPQG